MHSKMDKFYEKNIIFDYNDDANEIFFIENGEVEI